MARTDKERLATGFWNRIESNQATVCHHHKTTTTPTRGRGHSSKRSESWKDCQAKEHSFLSTLYHCIETSSTDTVTVVVPPSAPIVLPPTETIVLPPSETGIVPPPTDPENGTLPP